MRKAFYVFLLCSVLAAPFLGAPKAHAALLVNAQQKCLSVSASGQTAIRTEILAFECRGTFSQQWHWLGGAIRGIGTSAAVGRCVDVDGGGTADGTLVQLFDCNGTGAQQWIYDNGRIINVRSGKCLDDDGVSVIQARIRTCNGSDTQNWALRS